MMCLLDPELKPDETALVRHIYQCAAKTLAHAGHLPPAAFFRVGPATKLPGLKPGNIAALRLDMPGNDAGKDALASLMHEFAQRADADLAILLLESWMIKPNAKEAQYIKEHGEFLVRPSQHPQRIEIVLISVTKPGGQGWSAWVEISRDSNGRPSIPAELPPLEYLQSDGRFANILDGDSDRPSSS
ncbi:MAG: hypothetical protein PCFJNLEI_01630 [Verrucomicrobiae bacterium]|nr:hypothetical protein [Verrucomicrobiae bacterium]